MIWLIVSLLAIIAATLLFGSAVVQRVIGYAIGFVIAMIGNIGILLFFSIIGIGVYEGLRIVAAL